MRGYFFLCRARTVDTTDSTRSRRSELPRKGLSTTRSGLPSSPLRIVTCCIDFGATKLAAFFAGFDVGFFLVADGRPLPLPAIAFELAESVVPRIIALTPLLAIVDADLFVMVPDKALPPINLDLADFASELLAFETVRESDLGGSFWCDMTVSEKLSQAFILARAALRSLTGASVLY